MGNSSDSRSEGTAWGTRWGELSVVGGEELPRIQTAITTFADPRRLAEVLSVLSPTTLRTVVVYEDPSTKGEHAGYINVCDNFHVPLLTRPEWGCMQGIADFAFREGDCDWFIYYPDDVLSTPAFFDWARMWISTVPSWVGAIQLPYWNYQDLTSSPREGMFNGQYHWLEMVGFNPHWYGPCLYMNVNGATFALRKEAYENCGGLDLRTWCLDEYLAWALWTRTEYGIISVPGAPLVHQGGATTVAQHALGKAHHRHSTIEGWLDAVGKSKDECGRIIREIMHKRGLEWGIQPR